MQQGESGERRGKSSACSDIHQSRFASCQYLSLHLYSEGSDRKPFKTTERGDLEEAVQAAAWLRSKLVFGRRGLPNGKEMMCFSSIMNC